MNPRFHAILVLSTLAHCALASPPEELPVFPLDSIYEGLDAQVFPLGWASNGEQLAYLMAKPDEASGERTWELQILNLVTDKIIHKEAFTQPATAGVNVFWESHESEVEATLRQFNVTRHPFALNPFPALLGRYRADSYEIGLERVMSREPNYGYRGIQQMKITLTKNGGEPKTVKDTSWKEYYPLAAGVTGYLLNPEKNRIAIILSFTQRGYEGPPHVRLMQFVGARVGERF